MSLFAPQSNTSPVPSGSQSTPKTSPLTSHFVKLPPFVSTTHNALAIGNTPHVKAIFIPFGEYLAVARALLAISTFPVPSHLTVQSELKSGFVFTWSLQMYAVVGPPGLRSGAAAPACTKDPWPLPVIQCQPVPSRFTTTRSGAVQPFLPHCLYTCRNCVASALKAAV